MRRPVPTSSSFGNDVNGIILNRINRALAFDDVHVFSPTFLLNFRYGVTQQEFPEHRVSQGYDLTKLGFSPNLSKLIPAGQSAIPCFPEKMIKCDSLMKQN